MDKAAVAEPQLGLSAGPSLESIALCFTIADRAELAAGEGPEVGTKAKVDQADEAAMDGLHCSGMPP